MAVQHAYPATVPCGAVCGRMLLRPYARYTHHIEMGIGCVNPLHTGVRHTDIYFEPPREYTPRQEPVFLRIVKRR